MLDDDEFVAECSTSNVFAVIDGQLVTPPERRVLHGVTRTSILELAPVLGLTCTERDIGVEELVKAEEVFCTATSVGVWPVVRIDDHRIGDGSPGRVSASLRTTHRDIAAGRDPRFSHWLTICR